MSRFWRVWKYALGSFEDTKTSRYDNAVCITRSLILLTYLVTNCFITAGVIRKGFREVSSLELQACNTSLNNDECRDSYFEILNE